MAHKVHPKIFRTASLYTWDSKWFATKRTFSSRLKLDAELRTFLKQELKNASLDSIGVSMNPREVTISVLAGKPGVIIGRGGEGAEDLRKKIQKKFFTKDTVVRLNIQELQYPNLSAAVVLSQMAQEIEKRMPFRRVLKSAIERTQRAGALGVKVWVSGRLNGAEIARREMISWGKIPLQSLRADIDYAQGEAHTIYGTIGVKVWIYRGQVFGKKDRFVDDAKSKSFQK